MLLMTMKVIVMTFMVISNIDCQLWGQPLFVDTLQVTGPRILDSLVVGRSLTSRKIVGLNPARYSWLQLLADMFIWLSLVSSAKIRQHDL